MFSRSSSSLACFGSMGCIRPLSGSLGSFPISPKIDATTSSSSGTSSSPLASGFLNDPITSPLCTWYVFSVMFTTATVTCPCSSDLATASQIPTSVSRDAQIPSVFGLSMFFPTHGFASTLCTDLGSSVISLDALSVATVHAAACGTSLLKYTSFLAPSTTKPSCLM